MFYAKAPVAVTRLSGMTGPCAISGNRELIDQYLSWKRSHAAVAAKRYEIWVRRFQEKTNKAPEEFEIDDWNSFAEELRGRFAPKSVQYALNIVHNYLRFWHEQGRLRRFPLYLARVPKARARSHEAIPEEEYQEMKSVLMEKGEDGLRDLAIVMLLHDTGMRVGELASFRTEQLEPDASAVVHTEKTVSQRRVFWNKDTDQVLSDLQAHRVNEGPDSKWLFVPKSGDGEAPITTRSIQRIVCNAAKEAGIERKISPHSFRHEYIHRLAKLGIPDAIIAQLVGHGTPHTVAQYTKLSRPEFREFAKRQFLPAQMAAA